MKSFMKHIYKIEIPLHRKFTIMFFKNKITLGEAQILARQLGIDLDSFFDSHFDSHSNVFNCNNTKRK